MRAFQKQYNLQPKYNQSANWSRLNYEVVTTLYKALQVLDNIPRQTSKHSANTRQAEIQGDLFIGNFKVRFSNCSAVQRVMLLGVNVPYLDKVVHTISYSVCCRRAQLCTALPVTSRQYHTSLLLSSTSQAASINEAKQPLLCLVAVVLVCTPASAVYRHMIMYDVRTNLCSAVCIVPDVKLNCQA
eukprot:19124-Heterococcus_DN1.PRE.3